MKFKILIITLLIIPTTLVYAGGSGKTWRSIPVHRVDEEKVQEEPLTNIERRVIERLEKKSKDIRIGNSNRVSSKGNFTSSDIKADSPGGVIDSGDYSKMIPRSFEPWEKLTPDPVRPVKADPSYGDRKVVRGTEKDIQNTLEMAMSLLGNKNYEMVRPYDPWGAGIDCTGLVHFAYLYGANVDISNYPGDRGATGNTSSYYEGTLGVVVEQKDIIAGDILLFANYENPNIIGHAAISLGGNKYIHTGSKKNGVTISTLKGKPGTHKSSSGYKSYNQIMWSARRVIVK